MKDESRKQASEFNKFFFPYLVLIRNSNYILNSFFHTSHFTFINSYPDLAAFSKGRVMPKRFCKASITSSADFWPKFLISSKSSWV